MPTQSKFIRFIRRCCCCSVQNCEEEGRKKTKENKKSKKAKNNKKLRQKKRKERRNKKSKGLLGSSRKENKPSDGDNKHPLTSASRPDVNKDNEVRPLLKAMSLPSEIIVIQTSPLMNRQQMTSHDCNVTSSTVSLSQILVVISSSRDDFSSKYIFKKNKEPVKTSSVFSWGDLDISLHRLFHCKVQTTPSLLASDIDLRVSFQRLFDVRDHSVTSSFFSWIDPSSCVERLFQGSSVIVQSEASIPTGPVEDDISTIPSEEGSLIPFYVPADTSLQNATPSTCGSPEPPPATLETPKRYRPRKPRWPANPWLAPEYNGTPKTAPSSRWYEHVSNSEEYFTQMEEAAKCENVSQSLHRDQTNETSDVVQTDAQTDQTTSKDDERMEEDGRDDEEKALAEKGQMRSLIAPRPSCSGDTKDGMVDGDEVARSDATLDETDDGQQREEEAERGPKSTGELEAEKTTTDAFSRGGSERGPQSTGQYEASENTTTDAFSRGGSKMTASQPQSSCTGDDNSERKKQGVALVLSTISPFPVDGMKAALIPKLNLPSHVYGERLSQFHIDRASRETNACAINHTLIAVTYYSFGLQSGDLLDSFGLKTLPVQKWLWKTISVGNLLHRSIFTPSDCILATDAFKIVRSSFRLRQLVWRGSGGTEPGLPNRLRMLPRNLSLDIVYPTNSTSSLAYHAYKLNPHHMEAMLYTINNSFFLLVPTLDERVALIDIHPHPTLGGGSLIMFCTKNEKAVQDMLNEFYFKTIKPFHRFSLGQGNIICCKPETNGNNKLIPRNLKDWIAEI